MLFLLELCQNSFLLKNLLVNNPQSIFPDDNHRTTSQTCYTKTIDVTAPPIRAHHKPNTLPNGTKIVDFSNFESTSSSYHYNILAIGKCVNLKYWNYTDPK